MRGWVDAGYMPPSTLVAPTYYGEVPAEMWRITELWSDPAAAFVLDAAVADACRAMLELRAARGRLAEDSAYILTNRSHPTALRRASVTERALYFTAAVQAVGASERDGAGAGLCE